MAKALKIIGTVVAVVALAATGLGLAGVPALGSIAGVAGSGLAWATIATYAGLAAGVIGMAAQFLYKPPKFSQWGNPLKFQTNPQSPLPYSIGRTANAGIRFWADTWAAFKDNDGKDDTLGFGVLLSAGGPHESIETFTGDHEVITFDASTGAATAPAKYPNWMAQKVWMGGHMTSALALTFGSAAFGDIPDGWSVNHKLSGMTHAIWALRYDPKGEHYQAGVPSPLWVGKWAKVYDPRLDSTYPGGSGSCRALNESTYVWSRNGALHALTWALGRWQNGKKVLGIGAPVANIRVSDFVTAANLAETNKWWCGGTIYSLDSKWTVMQQMLQSCGAKPTMTGAMIGCRVSAPMVSVATISSSDLLDKLTISATRSQRDRINTLLPRFRSEANQWEIVTGSAVQIADYVTQDGRVRQREFDLPLVQAEVGQTDVNGETQAGQLAAYEIVNSREAGPFTFTTGPAYIGLKAGDCITLNVPEEGLVNQKCSISQPPSLDPASGKITFVVETETDAKHDLALGKTTAAPPPFSLSPPDLKPTTPLGVDWFVSAGLGADGLPAIEVNGGQNDGAYWKNIVIQYRKTADSAWIDFGTYQNNDTNTYQIMGLDGGTSYTVRIAFQDVAGVSDWLQFDPVVTGTSALQTFEASYDDMIASIAGFEALGNDGVLTVNEKVTKAIPLAVSLYQKWTTLSGVATTLGVSTTAAATAQTALATYLSGLSPAYDNTSADTTIVRADWDTAWNNYSSALYALHEAVDTKAAQMADWTGVSGIPYDDIRNNLIDLSWWKADAAIPWALNGSEYNRIVPVTDLGTIRDPRGGSDDLWYCKEQNNDGGEGGGWQWGAGTIQRFNVNKTYRFAVPVYRVSGSAGTYWGIAGDVADLNTTTAASNPYFVGGDTLITGRWYMAVGYIFPANSTGKTNDGAGLYDMLTGEKYAPGTNWCFTPAQPTGVGHRAYQYYATDGAEQLFGKPMIHLVDGAEPTLFPKTIRDLGYTGALNATYGATTAQASDISDAIAKANSKITTFYQTSAPTALATGDIWFDTDDKYKMYRWDGSAWQTSRDTDIALAITNAAGAQATADGKVTSFYQASPPTAEGVGDLWVDSDDNNRLYRWNGASWAVVSDARIAQALTDAAGAQATADGKVTTFYQTLTPTPEGVGDLWIDTDDGNKLYRWSGAAWTVIQDAGITSALTNASNAQSTANSKITTFYQGTVPTALAAGDLWVHTSDNYQLYRAPGPGTTWIGVRDNGAYFALLGLDGLGNVNTDKVATAAIQSHAVTSLDYAYTDGDSGVIGNFDTNWYEVQSLTITAVGSPILVNAAAIGRWYAGTNFSKDFAWRLVKNGSSVIYDGITSYATQGRASPINIEYIDPSPSGTTSYALQVQGSGFDSGVIAKRLVSALTLKR